MKFSLVKLGAISALLLATVPHTLGALIALAPAGVGGTVVALGAVIGRNGPPRTDPGPRARAVPGTDR